MQFRASIGGWRTTLLTAMGFGAAASCAGSVSSIGSTHSDEPHDSGPNEAGAPSSNAGGRGVAGASGGSSGSGGLPLTTGGVGGVADAGTGGAFTCVDPVPMYKEGSDAGPSGGFVRCASGAVIRPSAAECWSDLGLPDASGPVPGTTDASPCRTEADCTERPYGYCKAHAGIPAWYVTYACAYGCTRDSDCAPNELCRCGNPIGTCVQATCRTSSDCPTGVPCLETIANDFCGFFPVRYHCGIECRFDSDCQALGLSGTTCIGGGCVGTQVC